MSGWRCLLEEANREWRVADRANSLLAIRYSLLATRYSLLATRYSLLAIHQLRKQLRIHIAAGKDADHHLATNIAKAVEFAGEQRGEPDGAARLHHTLTFVKRIAHRS